jgi:uncharacterized membrane protein YfcA
MPESPLTWLLLSASAFAAGAVNAIAGGGTLLTFPSLLAVISPVFANATSTTALLPGSLASAWGYRQELARSRRHLTRLWPPSLVGGIIGSLLLTRMPERIFAGAVPWLLVTASVLLLVQKPLVRWVGAHPHAEPKASTLFGVVSFQLLVGIYGGYFGAGIGILMLSSLAFVGIHDIHEMNAVKNILAATMNGISVVIFMASEVIVWRYAAAMALSAIAGGYIGARIARRMPRDVVRVIVVVIGFGVAAYSYWSTHAAGR